MAFFSRNRNVAPVPQPIPPEAPVGFGGRIVQGSNVALDKASAIYHKNPKLIGGLAAVAGAILLTRMKRGRPSA